MRIVYQLQPKITICRLLKFKEIAIADYRNLKNHSFPNAKSLGWFNL
jgi:hypothetical protein